MINPSHLRVNISLVYHNEKITTVRNLHIYKGEYANFHPIPLTTDLLKVLQIPKFNGFSIVKVPILDGFRLYHDECFTGCTLKHIHELQNIYQAVTGSELQVNSKQMGTFLFLSQ